MGLANRLVAEGRDLAHAIALAKEIARLSADLHARRPASALRQWDLEEEEAIANEMRGGLKVIASGETLSGAAVLRPASAAMARSAAIWEALTAPPCHRVPCHKIDVVVARRGLYHWGEVSGAIGAWSVDFLELSRTGTEGFQ